MGAGAVTGRVARRWLVLVVAAAVGLAVLGSLAFVAAAGSRGVATAMPGPAHSARGEARELRKLRLDRNEDCVACHPDIAAEWQASLHRQAYLDPMFQAAFEREGESPFCQGCHAPEADPRRPVSDRQAEVGVGCVSCHVVGDGEVLATPANDGHDDSQVPHRLRREARFATADACAGCHEFNFPAAGRAGHQLTMQRTVREHARSSARDRSCQHCHMPPSFTPGGRVHRSHGFHVVGNLGLLRAAAHIEAERSAAADGERVRVVLEPRAVGHAFPTGDLFRRLEVRVDAEGWSATRYLSRHFDQLRLGSGATIKVEVDDDRVGVDREPRVIEFTVPARFAGTTLRWRVSWERVLEAPVGSPDHAQVWDATPVAAGELAPLAASAP